MKKYNLYILTILSIAILLISFNLSGCNWSEPNTKRLQPIRIGLSMATLQEERWRRDRDYFTERIRQLGGKVIFENANRNAQEQNQQVERLISQKIDVLVIIPQDLNQAALAVQIAKKAGVKIISYDRLIRNAPLDLYISFDSIKVGEYMAKYLVNKVPTGNYVIINGAPNDNNGYLLNQGYKNILKKYIKEKKIKVIFEAWAEDWRPEAAYQYIEALLNQGKKFQAVIASNDGLASAVIEALSEWRLAGKVLVAGHDADLSGCQRIVEGTQLMTVYKPIKKLAYHAADLAMMLGANKEITTNSLPIFNGKYLIPSETINPIPIDKYNIGLIIKDNYHQKEEIYLNISKANWPK
ncbi:MAG TPA: D-xylose transporter subunit XylF [Firmicutes bacterium]|jgi:D-xylose transport system substrate-binding protein|nr:D-xylose transporter subunit XylF [Bacillota bacterium]